MILLLVERPKCAASPAVLRSGTTNTYFIAESYLNVNFTASGCGLGGGRRNRFSVLPDTFLVVRRQINGYFDLSLFLTEQKANYYGLRPTRETVMAWLKDAAAGIGLVVFMASAFVLTNAVPAIFAVG
jgi:hypothetical protein